MKNRILLLIVIIVSFLAFVGCATQTTEPVADPPGFLHGLLHGFILLFSFIISLFTDHTIYAFPNTGGWYNLGFLLGVMMFFGGGGAGAKRKR
ncbi:MAG: hypothetical protein HQ541_22395 [Mariniphaga sp.]|nr:hypothetical protein [Mariniphaga sp.]